ncbi:C40 family peptidase [Reichenbachiella ulvae]|uniref:C40 family peptidase n=1 Tax=Reichenbachiella ulvae TaxID=2980104 RepID=A0ABT3CSX5_9BACT|nr:C40 family peptidase [Reichenbachiella ulvae]MCV9386778.1 C40 family peptidase [Reichenbachiella ulvae]
METTNPKGISRLAVIPMRNHSSHDAPMNSQILFGEHYQVIEQKEDWLKVQLVYDDSKGWIHQSQHSQISEEYFNQVNHSDYKVCTDLSGTIFFQKKKVQILLGSILPITTNELFKMEEQIAYNGESKSLSLRREPDFLLEVLKLYEHAPLLPGGKTPFGIDAAAFVQQVYKLCGYKTPRYLEGLCQSGKSVASIAEIKVGDLIISDSLKSGFIAMEGGKCMGMYKGCVDKVPLDQISDSIIIRRILSENL